METRHTSQKPIWLKHGDNRDVLVVTKGEDRFAFPVRTAIEACVQHDFMTKFTDELNERFNELLKAIAEWFSKNPDFVSVYLNNRSNQPFKFLLLLVTKGTSYNPDLEEAVIELDNLIYSKFKNNFQVRVQTIPEGVDHGVDSFVDIEEAYALHADSQGSQNAS